MIKIIDMIKVMNELKIIMIKIILNVIKIIKIIKIIINKKIIMIKVILNIIDILEVMNEKIIKYIQECKGEGMYRTAPTN